MKRIFFLGLLVFTSGFSTTKPTITSAGEQKALVEALSGAAHLGIGGLPTLLSQRFSDSAEIQTTAQFLKKKYEAANIAAEILDYDPLAVFPHYSEEINQTYRSYFRHLIPMLRSDFDRLCDGTLPSDKVPTVVHRLKRVGLEKEVLCEAPASDRVEIYIRTTVTHTTQITKRMLERRMQATWPNVMALVPTSPSSGETGVRPLCVIGAHMDSIAREGGGRGPVVSPTTLAPGADDNASGTAAVLTLARAMRDWVRDERPELSCDLAFVSFSGEEEGLFGSLAFVHLQSPRPIEWMVNFDMIAYNSGPTAIMNVGFDKRFGRQMAENFGGDAGALKTLIIERDVFLYSSDQISFWSMGIPAISISEQACSEVTCKEPFTHFNPRLHTPQDLAIHLDFQYAADIISHSFGGLKKVLTYKPH